MKRQAAIIAYDIVSNRRRRRLRRCLQAWRLDGQYSVFECRLNQQEAEELFLQLTSMIDENEDSLMLAWVKDPKQAHLLVGKGSIGFQQAGIYLG